MEKTRVQSAVEVHAIYHNKNGILQTKNTLDFQFSYATASYRVIIEQSVIRKISIACDTLCPLEHLNEMLLLIEQIIMLFEGRFLTLSKIIIDSVNDEEYNEDTKNWIDKRLHCYSSSDICMEKSMSLVDYQSVDIASLLPNWCKIREELQLIHPMFLYCLADTGMPVDCKCASLIEIFEPLAELIELFRADYTIPKVEKGESKLKKRLESIIALYGQNIFKREISKGIIDYLDKFVDTRNCIMHVSSKIGKRHLIPSECILYTAKLL